MSVYHGVTIVRLLPFNYCVARGAKIMATVIQDALRAAEQVTEQVAEGVAKRVAGDSEDLYSTDGYTSDEDDYEYDSLAELSAQQQWEQSVDQIERLFSQVVFPLIGKALGRKFSHLVWGRVATWWWGYY